MHTHEEIVSMILRCRTEDQLKEIADMIRFDNKNGLKNKLFYSGMLEHHRRFIPLLCELEKRGMDISSYVYKQTQKQIG